MMHENMKERSVAMDTVRLYHDIPKSIGVENALKRARQMLDIRWIPIEKFPSRVVVDAEAGTQAETWLKENRPQNGFRLVRGCRKNHLIVL